MIISGLQKMTLLDYPGKVACTVFLQGCNFRCPFCHNSDLLGDRGPEPISEEALFAFLKKRIGLLDAVCVTGGEPTLQKDLPMLLRKIKDLGFLVKLDTNGSRPAVLKAVAEAGLIDYVAMDIKNCPERYGETAGVPNMALSGIEESIRFLLAGHVDYEFRTTVADELHDIAAMASVGRWLTDLDPVHKAGKFYLQSYVDRDSVLRPGLHAPAKEKLREMAEALRPYTQGVFLRGND